MTIPRSLIALVATIALPPLLAAQTYPSTTDPRSGLKPGRLDAGTAESNMHLVSFSRKPVQLDSSRGLSFSNSDLAFGTHYVYQANFAGFTIWDVTSPAKPTVASVTGDARTSQGDVHPVIGHLLFISAEGAGNRTDCGKGGVQDPKDHMAGIRIFDVSDPHAPKLIKNVQTCKGSHTHTVVPSPTDKNIIYIYVSGQQAARPATELAGCQERSRSRGPDQLVVRTRHHQGPARSPGKRQGDSWRANLQRTRPFARVRDFLRSGGPESPSPRRSRYTWCKRSRHRGDGTPRTAQLP